MRTLRHLPVVATLALGLQAGAASGLELENLSAEERQLFRDEVRAYLMENPEVLMEAIAVLEDRQATQQATADKSLVSNLSDEIFNDGRSWAGGNLDGDVTLVEFIDYRCGYCKRAHDDVSELVNSDGNIRLVMKEFPILGPESLLASRFAIATRLAEGADAYKQVNDALIKHNGSLTEGALRRMAKTLKLDADKIMAEMDNPEVVAELSANRDLAGKLSVNGTPTFVMGDELLRGYVPLASMRELVEAVRTN